MEHFVFTHLSYGCNLPKQLPFSTREKLKQDRVALGKILGLGWDVEQSTDYFWGSSSTALFLVRMQAKGWRLVSSHSPYEGVERLIFKRRRSIFIRIFRGLSRLLGFTKKTNLNYVHDLYQAQAA